MKIRTGFVSNSSSSSFCIYGIDMSRDKFYEIEDKLKELDYSYGISDYDDLVIVGLCPEDIKNEETGLEFKNRVKELILKETGIDEACGWYTDGGYNG